jgi:flagellin
MALTLNMNSGFARRQVSQATRNLSSSFSKVSSGKRITKAADDAAGMAVASNLDTKARSTKQAMRNTNDGISMIQVAEGAYETAGNIYKRMRELAVQGSSETLANTERGYLSDEYIQLSDELDQIAKVTEFNGINLTASGSNSIIEMQVGINNSSNDRISVRFGKLDADSTLQAQSPFTSIASMVGAQRAIDNVTAAIDELNGYRSDLGAVQNRLVSALRGNETYYENLVGAQSQIEDLDYAHETANLAKAQIMQQASMSVLAQSRSIDEQILSLI